MGKQPKIEQWEITSEFKTSNNYSIRCINERLGVYCQDQRTGSHSQSWKKKTYKHTGSESSKVCDIAFHKNLPTNQNNSFGNGQHSITFLHCQMAGTHNKVLSDLAEEIWDYLLANGIMITVEYLPGTLSVKADHQSRSVTDSSEWKLNQLIFKKICKVFWTPDIDLFASRISHQVPAYIAWKTDPSAKERIPLSYLGEISRNASSPPFAS